MCCRADFNVFTPETYQLQFVNFTVIPIFSAYYVDGPGISSVPYGIVLNPPVGSGPPCRDTATLIGPVLIPRPTATVSSSDILPKAQILTVSKLAVIPIGNDTLPGLSTGGPTLPLPDATAFSVDVSLPTRPIVG